MTDQIVSGQELRALMFNHIAAIFERPSPRVAMHNPIAQLMAVAAAASGEATIPQELAAAFTAAVADIAKGAAADEALGLVAHRGGRRVTTTAKHQQRNALIRSVAAKFFADMPAAQQAENLHKSLARYAASAWQTDRPRAGSLQWHFRQILQLKNEVISASRLRKILATSEGYS